MSAVVLLKKALGGMQMPDNGTSSTPSSGLSRPAGSEQPARAPRPSGSPGEPARLSPQAQPGPAVTPQPQSATPPPGARAAEPAIGETPGLNRVTDSLIEAVHGAMPSRGQARRKWFWRKLGVTVVVLLVGTWVSVYSGLLADDLS